MDHLTSTRVTQQPWFTDAILCITSKKSLYLWRCPLVNKLPRKCEEQNFFVDFPCYLVLNSALWCQKRSLAFLPAQTTPAVFVEGKQFYLLANQKHESAPLGSGVTREVKKSQWERLCSNNEVILSNLLQKHLFLPVFTCTDVQSRKNSGWQICHCWLFKKMPKT